MVIKTGPLTIDTTQVQATVNGHPVRFSAQHKHREWLLLVCLSQRAGQDVPLKTLAREVLGWPDTGRFELRNLRAIRARLMARLGPACAGLIRSIPRRGARLELRTAASRAGDAADDGGAR